MKDLVYLPKSRRFAALFNRFRWEEAVDARTTRACASGLHFDDVHGVQGAEPAPRQARCRGLAAGDPLHAAEAARIRAARSSWCSPAAARMRLEVECIDAGLGDIGGEWAALRPSRA